MPSFVKTLASSLTFVSPSPVDKRDDEQYLAPIKIGTGNAADPSDGTVGIAFRSLNSVTKPGRQNTFFDDIKSSLSSPVIGIDLQRGRPGNFDFGKLPSNRYTGYIGYAPMTGRDGYWGFEVGGVSINGQMLASPHNRFEVMLDTTVSLLMLHPALVRQCHALVPGARMQAQRYRFPCNAKLPDLSFKVEEHKTSTIPGGLINYRPMLNDKTIQPKENTRVAAWHRTRGAIDFCVAWDPDNFGCRGVNEYCSAKLTKTFKEITDRVPTEDVHGLTVEKMANARHQCFDACADRNSDQVPGSSESDGGGNPASRGPEGGDDYPPNSQNSGHDCSNP
ncbi:hypothetical protein MAPG_11300 [Magnaporthiopsis poae ATCC 64411]|uniref:Peptidase A1 domain-containing protein n=1 Tax=Magnaporthiopsis poae (strain ATCC 64411 / 73-15) TaxID=644358 RepID=A0A0C4EEW8_MAGP6|nr:hypothetical protein MAPG_11300 [Magnaporthiopsis poae ATCC 64411]